jgi:hypothetical protein
MPYHVDADFKISCDTPAEAIALLDLIVGRKSKAAPATLAAAKKPGPKPKPATDDVLSPEQKAKLAAEVPLICRKPHGCGKPFQSANRKAWYCPACDVLRRDEGRPA